MKNVYTCLLGKWVNLSEDASCTVGHNGQNASTWFKEGGDLWLRSSQSRESSFSDLDYVWIHYQGKSYRINPVFIQIVEE